LTRDLFTPDCALARALPSPSHGERKRPVFALVLHYTGVPTTQAALDLLLSPASEVSAHYLVEEDGGVLQLVPETRRAWHAGRSFWAGETDMNSASIGVEIQHPGHSDPRPYLEAQIAAVTALARDVCARHAIEPRHVLAHSDIAISRKLDPGEFFPWERLAAAGVGLYPTPAAIGDDVGLTLGSAGAEVAALRAKLAAYGYQAAADGPFDEALEAVVKAFQRRFRPERIDGRADRSTLATLDALLSMLESNR